MTQLHQRVKLACPPLEAEERLVRYLRLHGERECRTEFHLRLPIAEYGEHGELSIERNVIAHIRRTCDETKRNTVFQIEWEPEGKGPFPSFKGRLMTWSDEDDGTCYLDLRGSYDPPARFAGVVFDAAVGHRVAGATAFELLSDLKTGIEREVDARAATAR